jgi:hypothetical protein
LKGQIERLIKSLFYQNILFKPLKINIMKGQIKGQIKGRIDIFSEECPERCPEKVVL